VGEQAGGVSLRGETSASQKVETVTDHKQLHNFFDGKCSLGIAILTLSLAWGVKTDGVRDQKLLDLNDYNSLIVKLCSHRHKRSGTGRAV